MSLSTTFSTKTARKSITNQCVNLANIAAAEVNDAIGNRKSNCRAASDGGGIGFAGGMFDTKESARCIKQAHKRTQQHDTEKIAQLSYMMRVLTDHWDDWDFLQCFLISDRFSKLHEMLLEVIRNYSIMEWEERGSVLMAALRLCHLITSDLQLSLAFFTRCSCSLLSSLDDLADQAKFIAQQTHHMDEKSSTNSPSDMAIATFLLQVQDEAHRAIAQIAKHQNIPNISSLEEPNPSIATSFQLGKTTNSPSQQPSLEDEYKRRLGKLRIDFVDNLPNHAFGRNNKVISVGDNYYRRLYKELLSLRASLPLEYGSSIFVRVDSSRINLIRALVIGAEGTPYANGCFVFDIMLPDNYPKVPPKVKFCTTGDGCVRFNPNLYKDGKVCLSLLGTWSGPGWIANQSTLLQVLVSIQSMIFVPDPYFNEPGWDAQRGTTLGKKASECYNSQIREYTWKYAILDPLQQCCRAAASSRATIHAKDKSNYASVSFSSLTSSFSNCPEFMQIITEHFCCKSQIVCDQIHSWFSTLNRTQTQPKQRYFSFIPAFGLKPHRGNHKAAIEETSDSRLDSLQLFLNQLLVSQEQPKQDKESCGNLLCTNQKKIDTFIDGLYSKENQKQSPLTDTDSQSEKAAAYPMFSSHVATDIVDLTLDASNDFRVTEIIDFTVDHEEATVMGAIGETNTTKKRSFFSLSSALGLKQDNHQAATEESSDTRLDSFQFFQDQLVVPNQLPKSYAKFIGNALCIDQEDFVITDRLYSEQYQKPSPLTHSHMEFVPNAEGKTKISAAYLGFCSHEGNNIVDLTLDESNDERVNNDREETTVVGEINEKQPHQRRMYFSSASALVLKQHQDDHKATIEESSDTSNQIQKLPLLMHRQRKIVSTDNKTEVAADEGADVIDLTLDE
jgi:ubiquitin-protein ligase